MGLQKYKNAWGAQGSNLDPLRTDLFYIDLVIPPQVLGGGVNLWESEVTFGVEGFPFPERSREMIGVKQWNQTNFVIGADTPTSPVDISIRWAFNRRTAEILERWHQLTSNSQNGGVSVTSQVKTNGNFYHLIPNTNALANPGDTTAGDAFTQGPTWYLEGVLVRGLKPTEEANMKVGNEIVHLSFNVQIDRYYPIDPSDLSVLGAV